MLSLCTGDDRLLKTIARETTKIFNNINICPLFHINQCGRERGEFRLTQQEPFIFKQVVFCAFIYPDVEFNKIIRMKIRIVKESQQFLHYSSFYLCYNSSIVQLDEGRVHQQKYVAVY